MLKCRLTYLFALVGAVLFYIFFNGYLSYYILLFALLLPVLSLILSLPGMCCVRAVLQAPAAASRGKPFPVYLQIQNRSHLPAARIRLRMRYQNQFSGEKYAETLFLPGPHGVQRVERRAVALHCGKLSMQLDEIRCYDFMGLFSCRHKPPEGNSLFILPDAEALELPLQAAPAPDPESELFSSNRPGSDPSEIFDIRPYREGDLMRSVHWKLSSRMDELMVKEFSLPISNAVLVLFDLFGTTEDLDRTLDHLSSLCYYLLDNQMPHEIMWYDAEEIALRSWPIASPDDFLSLMNVVLDKPAPVEGIPAPECRQRLGEAKDVPYLFYVTPQRIEDLSSSTVWEGAI